ncbi:MAG: hypothetical protein IJZ85_07150 [Lachnospiraceae bacterium]|nr:hypothetical protein [Lachnospiraceae bacterium]
MNNKVVLTCLTGVLSLVLLQGCASVQTTVQDEETFQTEIEIQEFLETELDDNSDRDEAEAIMETKKAKIRYSPDGYSMWDSWYVEKDGEIHLIHLKGLAGGISYNEAEEAVRGYGHAVTPDLVHWTEQQDILNVDRSKHPYDQEFRYTGCTVEHEGTYYTFYTMRKGLGQRIGVATSKDLYEWKEYEGNPVLVPNEQWFITFANENVSNHKAWGGVVDCRDMLVVKDDQGDGFWGYFVASADTGKTTPTSVVGVAYSWDLLNWEQRGIAYMPDSVAMPEMIDVFQIGEKWYMTLTTAKNNGCLSGFSDPYITRAQIYAVSDSPQGPFVENYDDNVMMGGQLSSGYSSRSIVFEGKRRVLYTDNNYGNAVVSLPKDVNVNEDRHLRLYYSGDILQNIRTGELKNSIAIQPTTSFAWNTKGGDWKKNGDNYSCSTDRNSWQAFLMKGMANNLELEFVMDGQSDCSMLGIVLSNRGDGKYLNDLNHILAIDLNNDRVYLTNAEWDLTNCREYLFEENTEYHFRMLLLGNTIELYINDEFVFNSGIDNAGANRAGLFVNDGTIQINDLALYGLEE